ncbi:hypothetical protein LIA77_02097 [Sarocladium implicatum]|nr:hypothetical protein LIA77_02097 [Sarocladium implicatum]
MGFTGLFEASLDARRILGNLFHPDASIYLISPKGDARPVERTRANYDEFIPSTGVVQVVYVCVPHHWASCSQGDGARVPPSRPAKGPAQAKSLKSPPFSVPFRSFETLTGLDPGDQSHSHGARHPRPKWSACQRHVALGGPACKSRCGSPIVNHQHDGNSGAECLADELVSWL